MTGLGPPYSGSIYVLYLQKQPVEGDESDCVDGAAIRGTYQGVEQTTITRHCNGEMLLSNTDKFPIWACQGKLCKSGDTEVPNGESLGSLSP